MKHAKKTYLLYGVADRDPDERVAMFFGELWQLVVFAEELPGKYDVMTIHGVDLMSDAITIGPSWTLAQTVFNEEEDRREEEWLAHYINWDM